MYGDRLDYSFHLETLKELLRVTSEEVRIFPLVDLNGKRYQHLEALLGEFGKKCSYNVEGI
ncbi:MAG: hypothetical protein ACQEWV_00350 [Bacillota bacterium]